MTEESLVTALLENYREQFSHYRRIREGLRTALAHGASPALDAAQERGRAFGEIERLNEEIRPLKALWESGKDAYRSIGAETLKGLLAAMGETVSQIIADSRRMEEALLQARPKPAA